MKNDIKIGLILAGGNGTRLYPITTEEVPKPLLPIAGKPIIGRIIDGLKAAGIKDIYVITRKGSEALQHYIENQGAHSIEQKEAKGTGHAVLLAKEYIDKPFLIASGDHVLDWSIYKDVVRMWKGENTVVVKYLKDVSRFGVLSLKCGKVMTAKEKPKDIKEGFANLGIYAVHEDIFAKLEKIKPSPRGEYEFTDLLPGFRALATMKEWIDIAYPWHLIDAFNITMEQLPEKREGEVINSTLRGKVIVEKDAVIDNAVIEGPAYIGRGAHIGPFTYVNKSMVGAGSYIGTGTSVVRSYLMLRTYAKHLSYIGDSVVGKDVNFGGGAKVANLRFDDKTVKVMRKGKLIDTGKKKFGAIIGEKVKIGINASIMPGTVVDAGKRIMPNEVVYPQKAPKEEG